MFLELNSNREVIFDKQLHLQKTGKWEREENTDAYTLITTF